MRLRFPKGARLTRATEFQRLKKEGTAVHGRFMVLSALSVPLAVTRVGFITSRRVGPAVVRNRVRRRLREIARLARPNLRDGFWVVVIARQHAGTASFESMQKEWMRLAARAGILSES